jgi:hypothetical protein
MTIYFNMHVLHCNEESLLFSVLVALDTAGILNNAIAKLL